VQEAKAAKKVDVQASLPTPVQKSSSPSKVAPANQQENRNRKPVSSEPSPASVAASQTAFSWADRVKKKNATEMAAAVKVKPSPTASTEVEAAQTKKSGAEGTQPQNRTREPRKAMEVNYVAAASSAHAKAASAAETPPLSMDSKQTEDTADVGVQQLQSDAVETAVPGNNNPPADVPGQSQQPATNTLNEFIDFWETMQVNGGQHGLGNGYTKKDALAAIARIQRCSSSISSECHVSTQGSFAVDLWLPGTSNVDLVIELPTGSTLGPPPPPIVPGTYDPASAPFSTNGMIGSGTDQYERSVLFVFHRARCLFPKIQPTPCISLCVYTQIPKNDVIACESAHSVTRGDGNSVGISNHQWLSVSDSHHATAAGYRSGTTNTTGSDSDQHLLVC
jgi:hypothetical protein